MTTDRWGIDTQWIDADQRPQTVATETLACLRELIGEPPTDLESRAPVFARTGGRLPSVQLPAVIDCEDGSTRRVDDGEGTLPADVPLGYHWVRGSDDVCRRLIVSPGVCWQPAGRRAWGLSVQLYAARSRAGAGIGDLADLRALRVWAESHGAGFLMVNPLHAVAPTLPQQPSPYLPATRGWRNPIYLRLDEVPGALAALTESDLSRAAELRACAELDRDGVWALKRAVLERAFAKTSYAGGWTHWVVGRGEPLRRFAVWSALADVHGPDFQAWPAELRHPEAPAVARFAAEHPAELAFHGWLQWALETQLDRASGDVTVIQDLPIGVAGGGADAWQWQDLLAGGVEIGAPPDLFNATGQAWGSPPYVPWRLRAADYEPFIQSVRGTIAGAGGLRIDHVLGLFRLWWVPPGGRPVDGAYVRYRCDDLLDIVALESHRARAMVVGEDLGTVEAGVREILAGRRLLAYKVLWFEPGDPATWPTGSMAAVTTHDLPTVAGLWSGDDLREQQQCQPGGDAELAEARRQLLGKLAEPAALSSQATTEDAVLAAHRRIARSPSALLSATLEDVVGQHRRPNLPGTTKRANWSVPLPVHVDDLPQHALANAVAGVLAAAMTEPTPGAE